jgi:hypothetical protein
MKKLLLVLGFVFFSFTKSFSQNWSQVPGYQVSYGDVMGVTRYQGNIWVEATSGIYQITGSTWTLTSTNFSIVTTIGCLYTDGNDLYAGSLFDFGSSKAIVLKWNGAQWIPIGYTDNSASAVWVSTILKTSSGLYVGGFFNFIGNSPTTLSSLRLYAFLSGSTWTQPFTITNFSCATSVESIQMIGDSVYVAGKFPEISNTWTPATFRFKEGGGISSLDGYGFCALAKDYCFYQNTVYVGGTRQHDNLNVNVGLTKRVNNQWSAVSSQMQLTNTKVKKLIDRIFIAGDPGLVNGSMTNICSYNGVIFTNEGVGISYPSSSNIYPVINSLFVDTISGQIYAAGNFLQSNGNVASNFAVRNIYPLPVHLSSFIAQVVAGSNVKLQWRDETPENGIKFQVQVSTDGQNFESIGEVIEQGSRKDYSFIYSAKSCGKLYFRLSFEGKYSETKAVSIPCDISITSDTRTLRIQTKYPGTLTLSNSVGQTLTRTVLSSGYKVIPLQYSTGVYIANFIDVNGSTYNQKILIQ